MVIFLVQAALISVNKLHPGAFVEIVVVPPATSVPLATDKKAQQDANFTLLLTLRAPVMLVSTPKPSTLVSKTLLVIVRPPPMRVRAAKPERVFKEALFWMIISP